MKKYVSIACAGILALSMGAFCAGCSGSTDTSSDTSSTESTEQDTYVDAEWLSENLDDVIVVDARDADTYATGHIEGAINAGYATVCAAFMDSDTINTTLAGLGIDGSKEVVVYTDISIYFGEDGCFKWTAAEAGITDVKILDGGWAAWQAADGATCTKTCTLDAVDAPELEDACSISIVDGDYVNEHLTSSTIVDVRSKAEYNGETNYGEAKLGRIPGAVSLAIDSLYNDDYTIKSDSELASLFEEAGLTDKDAEIITYCTGGIRAGDVAELLEEQGFTNVKVYAGSFTDWAANDAYEVEK